MSKFDLLPPLPPVLRPTQDQSNASFVEKKEEATDESKRFVIVCSRDLSAEDEAIFKQH